MIKLTPMSLHTKRGMTLVELMIVVAIIGVLATIASVSFTKYVKQAKITQLKQYAMDVARGQEQFRSRNSVYYPRDSNVLELTSATSGEPLKPWTQLLEFNHKLEEGVTVETQAGIGNKTCTICEGMTPKFAENGVDLAWYAIRVSQPLNSKNASGQPSAITAVILNSDGLSPVVLREGE